MLRLLWNLRVERRCMKRKNVYYFYQVPYRRPLLTVISLHSWNSAKDRLCAVLCLVIQVCLTLCDPMDCSPPGSSVHGDSPGKDWSGLPCPPSGDLLNPGVPDLPHYRQILYWLSRLGSSRTLEWVAIPSPGVIPYPGIKSGSPALQADSLPVELPQKLG